MDFTRSRDAFLDLGAPFSNGDRSRFSSSGNTLFARQSPLESTLDLCFFVHSFDHL